MNHRDNPQQRADEPRCSLTLNDVARLAGGFAVQLDDRGCCAGFSDNFPVLLGMAGADIAGRPLAELEATRVPVRLAREIAPVSDINKRVVQGCKATEILLCLRGGRGAAYPVRCQVAWVPAAGGRELLLVGHAATESPPRPALVSGLSPADGDEFLAVVRKAVHQLNNALTAIQCLRELEREGVDGQFDWPDDGVELPELGSLVSGMRDEVAHLAQACRLAYESTCGQ